MERAPFLNQVLSGVSPKRHCSPERGQGAVNISAVFRYIYILNRFSALSTTSDISAIPARELGPSVLNRLFFFTTKACGKPELTQVSCKLGRSFFYRCFADRFSGE